METIRKALLETAVLLAIAAAVAGLLALGWVGFVGGEFVPALGLCLILIGALLGMTDGLSFGRHGTADTYAFFGQGIEMHGAGGGRVLTGVGIFLFVSIPLIFVGGLIIL